MKKSTTHQPIAALAWVTGFAEGRAKGYAEGFAKGRIEEARRLVLLLGEEKLQAPADAMARAAVKAIGEVERLEELCLQVLHLSSWQELLAAAARLRSNGPRKAKLKQQRSTLSRGKPKCARGPNRLAPPVTTLRSGAERGRSSIRRSRLKLEAVSV